MAKFKNRPVNIPGPINRRRHPETGTAGNLIDLAGFGLPIHQMSRPHKNRAKLDVSAEKGIIKLPLSVNHFPHLDLGWNTLLCGKASTAEELTNRMAIMFTPTPQITEVLRWEHTIFTTIWGRIYLAAGPALWGI